LPSLLDKKNPVELESPTGLLPAAVKARPRPGTPEPTV
jgi:hypothetical protein